jgi:calcineurin-like phosphoesterase family protein
MDIFFTSDQHYGHKNIIKYANRPFASVDEMNETLIENHNKTVGHRDIVWMLGDFAFMQPNRIKQVLQRLNGQKNLVLGNHDKGIAKHRREYIGEGLFNAIYDAKELNWEGQHICLFHYGGRVWNKSHRGSWMLYGHSHGSLPPFGKSVDVGVDDKNITDEYRPVSFDEVKAFMATRLFQAVDHHGG